MQHFQVGAAGGSPVSAGLQFHLKHTSKPLCVGGLHLQLTFWKKLSLAGKEKQRGDGVTVRV